MFELFKSVAAAFGGRLSEAPEARKLVWLMLVTLFFGGCCVFFVAYVSYSRYRAVAGFLPGADVVAFCFTAGIALFMYYASSHVSAFAIELWLRGGSRLAWQGAVLIAIAGMLVGVIDYRMNVDGAQDVARASVGETAAVDESALVKPFAESIAALESRKAVVLQKYHWKGKLYFEPYPVTRHSQATWSLDTAKVNQLDRQIAVQEELKAAALADARAQYAGEKSRKRELRDTTHKRLQVAVRGVYFLQFLLTLVLAFILLQMDDALRGSGGRTAAVKAGQHAIGFGTAAVPSSADRNRLERLQREIEMLKNAQNGSRVPENTAGVTEETVAVQKETAAVMDETVGVMQPPESETLTVYHHSKGFKIICENCGKEAVKKSPQARFCSTRCRIRSWNGRHPGQHFPEG